MTAYPRAGRRARKTAAKRAKRQDERKFLVWHAIDRVRGGSVVFVPGYVLPSLANERLHWRYLATIKARQKDLGRRVGCMLHEHGCIEQRVTITLKRVGKRLLDDDNLASAFKHVRDGIAEAFGVDDGPRGPITWAYEQDASKTPGIEARWSR